jgi:hypothetical protein
MSQPNSFSSLRFREYARDLSEAVHRLGRAKPMGATSDLRSYLGDDQATVRFGLYKKIITSHGKTVEVAQEATNAEVAQALKDAGYQMTDQPDPATPLPPAPTITAVPKPAAHGSFAASLKAIVDEALAGAEKAKADGLSKVRTAVGKIGEATAATVRVTDNMASNIEDQAASISTTPRSA